jgi:hypothetical protein
MIQGVPQVVVVVVLQLQTASKAAQSGWMVFQDFEC